MARYLYAENMGGVSNSIKLWQVPNNSTKLELLNRREENFTSVDAYIDARQFITNRELLRRDLCLRIEHNEIGVGTLVEILASSQDGAVKALAEDIYKDIQNGGSKVDNTDEAAVYSHKILGTLLTALSKLYEMQTQTPLAGTRQIIDTPNNRKEPVYMPQTFGWVEETFPFIKNIRQPQEAGQIVPPQSEYVSEIVDTTKPNLGLSYAEASRRLLNIAYAPGGRAEGELSLETLQEDVDGFSEVFAEQIKNGVAVPENQKPLVYAERPEGKTSEPVSVPGSYIDEDIKTDNRFLSLGLPPKSAANTYRWDRGVTDGEIEKWLSEEVASVFGEQSESSASSINMLLNVISPAINVQPVYDIVNSSYIEDTNLIVKRGILYLRYMARLALQRLGKSGEEIDSLIPRILTIKTEKGNPEDEESVTDFNWDPAAVKSLLEEYKKKQAELTNSQKIYFQLLQDIYNELMAWNFTKEAGKPVVATAIKESKLIGQIILTVGDYQTALERIAGYNQARQTTREYTEDGVRIFERMFVSGGITVVAKYKNYKPGIESPGKLEERGKGNFAYVVRGEAVGELVEMTYNGYEVRHEPFVDNNENKIGARTIYAKIQVTTTTKTDVQKDDGVVELPVTTYPGWPLTFTETELIYPHLNEKNSQGIVALVRAGKVSEARAAYSKLTGEVYAHILAQLEFSKDPQALRAIARVTAQLNALDELIKAYDIEKIENDYIAQRTKEASDLAEKVNKYDLNSGSLSARQANLQQYLLELEAQQALLAEDIGERKAQTGVKHSLKAPLLKQSENGVYTGEERDEDGDGKIDTIANFGISATYTPEMQKADKALNDEIARVRRLLCGQDTTAAARNYLLYAFGDSTAEEEAVLRGLARRLQAEDTAQKAAAAKGEIYQPQIAEETKKFWLSLLLAHLPAISAPADRAFVENLARELKVTKAAPVSAGVGATGVNSAASVFATQEKVESAKASLTEDQKDADGRLQEASLVQQVFDKIKNAYVDENKEPTEEEIAAWIAAALTDSGLRPALNVLVGDNDGLQNAHKLPDDYVLGASPLAEALAAKSILVFDNTNVLPVEIRCNPGAQDEMLQLIENMLAALRNDNKAEADGQVKELRGLIKFNKDLADVFGGTVEDFGQQLKADYLDLMQATDPDAQKKLLGNNPDFIDGDGNKTWRVGDPVPPEWGVVDTAWHSIVPPEGTDERIQAMSENYEDLAGALETLKNIEQDKLTEPEYYAEVRDIYQKAYDLLRDETHELPARADGAAELAPLGVYAHLNDADFQRPVSTLPGDILEDIQGDDDTRQPLLPIALFPKLDKVMEARRGEHNEEIVTAHDRQFGQWLADNPLATPEQKHQAAADTMTKVFAEKAVMWQDNKDKMSADFTEYRNELTLTPYPLFFGGKMPEPPDTEQKEEGKEKDDKVFPGGELLRRHIDWDLAKQHDLYNQNNYNDLSYKPVHNPATYGEDQLPNFSQTLNPDNSNRLTDAARKKLAEFWTEVARVKTDTSDKMKDQGYTDEEIVNTLNLIQNTAERLAPQKTGLPIIQPGLFQPFLNIGTESLGGGFTLANQWFKLSFLGEQFFPQENVAKDTDFLGGHHFAGELSVFPWANSANSWINGVRLITGFDYIQKQWLIHTVVSIRKELEIENDRVVRAEEVPTLNEAQIDELLNSIEGLSSEGRQKFKDQLRSEKMQTYNGAPHVIVAALRGTEYEKDIPALLDKFYKKAGDVPADATWVVISGDDLKFYADNGLYYKTNQENLTIGQPVNPPVYLGTGKTKTEAEAAIKTYLGAELGREPTTEEITKYLAECESGAKLDEIGDSAAADRITGADKNAVIGLIKTALKTFCTENNITHLYNSETETILELKDADTLLSKLANAYYDKMSAAGKVTTGSAAVSFQPGAQTLSVTRTGQNARSDAETAMKTKIAQAVADFAAANNISGYKNSDGTPATQAVTLADTIYNGTQLAKTITETNTLTVSAGTGTPIKGAAGSDVATARDNIITALKAIITKYCTDNTITKVTGYDSIDKAAEALATDYFDNKLTAAQKTLIANWSLTLAADSTEILGSEYGTFADAETGLKASLKTVLKSFCDNYNPKIELSDAELNDYVNNYYAAQKYEKSQNVTLLSTYENPAYLASGGTIDSSRVTAVSYTLGAAAGSKISRSLPAGQYATAANLQAVAGLLDGDIDARAVKVKTTAPNNGAFTAMTSGWKAQITGIKSEYFDATNIITCDQSSGITVVSVSFPAAPTGCKVDCVLRNKTTGKTYTLSDLDKSELVVYDSNNNIIGIKIYADLGAGKYALEYTLVSTVGETINNAVFAIQELEINDPGYTGGEVIVGTQTNKNPFRVVGYEVDDYNIDRDVTVKTPAVLNINTSTTTASSSGLAYEVLPPAITAVPSAAVEVTNFGLNAVSGSTSVPGIDKDGITASILYNVFKLPVTFTVTHEVPVQTAGLLERLWYRPALKETLQNIDVERLSQKLALWFGVGWDATFDFRKMVIKDKNGKEVEIEQGFVLTAAVELLAGWISLKETNQVINADDAEALLALLQQRNPGQFENTDTAQWDLAYKFALGIVYQFSEKHQLGLEVMLDKGLTNTPQTDPSSSDIMLPSNLTFSLDYKLPINERWLFNPATSLSINFTPDEVFCNLHAKLAAVWTPTDKLMLTPRYEFYYGHRGSEDTSMKHTLGLGLGLRFAKNLLFQASMDGNVQFKSFLSDPVWGFGARLGILWTF